MDEVKRCPFCGGKAKLMGGKVYTIPEIERINDILEKAKSQGWLDLIFRF